MTELSEEDLERLASRMAMLVSEAGEADNAGRAVASLARRLGLSGGQIKAFFLAGAGQTLRRSTDQTPGRPNADPAAEIDRLEHEVSALRHGLKLTEVQARNAQRENFALRTENSMLLESLDRARSAAQVRKYVGAALVAAIALSAAVMIAGPSLHLSADLAHPPRPPGSPFQRAATIRPSGAAVLLAPEQGSPVVAQLTGGTRVQVRQLVWRALMQWAEIEVGGVSGYVLSTEIDLS